MSHTPLVQVMFMLQNAPAPALALPGVVWLCLFFLLPFYVILCTARGGKDSLLDAFEAGVDDFVSKPFDREVLQARIKVGVRAVELQSYLIQRLSTAEAALQSVSQLKNFVSICSVCGRAKDLADQWHKIELPFQTGTGDTAFHSCCPDCRGKMDRVR